MKKILFIFGTRPEAIKLAPVIQEFKKYHLKYVVRVCVTAQHRKMLDNVLTLFKIKPDYDLNLMKPNQSLFDITSQGIRKMELVLKKYAPDLIFLQGDTTSTFVGAISGYYLKMKVAHIEAGLRSHDKYSPFPEEMNRLMVDHIADYHFAPTKKARDNLYREGIKNNVWIVGNTVIDALFSTLKIIKDLGEKHFYKYFRFLDFSKKILLVTCHRRESFGIPIKNICLVLKNIANTFKNIEIVFPVHLNPNVYKPVHKILQQEKNIHLIKHLSYHYFVWLMSKSYMILTDSGGIQEETPSLKKPVLVMRNVTERLEGIEAKNAILVGTQESNILDAIYALLTDKNAYAEMTKAKNPYGDGQASKRILKIIEEVINL